MVTRINGSRTSAVNQLEIRVPSLPGIIDGRNLSLNVVIMFDLLFIVKTGKFNI